MLWGGVPAGQKFDVRQGPRLREFLEPVVEHCFRVLKPGGFMLCFTSPRLSHHTTIVLETAGFEIRDLLAWRYEGQAKAFSQAHFVRKMGISDERKTQILTELNNRKTPQLKPQMEMIALAQKPKEGTFIDNWLQHGTGLVDMSEPLIEPGRTPGTIMPCPKPTQKYGHLTAKPVLLCQHLIRLFGGKPGGLIVDPFTGSGTTGVAALKENYRFYGYEKDVAMACTAQRRIEKADKERN